MLLADWPACAEDGGDWGELLSERVAAVLLVSRSVPGRKSWCVGGQSYTQMEEGVNKKSTEISDSHLFAFLHIDVSFSCPYLPYWQLTWTPQLDCPAHSPPLPPTQVADRCCKYTTYNPNTRAKRDAENSSPFAEVRTSLLFKSKAGWTPCEVSSFPPWTSWQWITHLSSVADRSASWSWLRLWDGQKYGRMRKKAGGAGSTVF